MTNLLDPTIEGIIKDEVIKLLSTGRTDWDVRHTFKAVDWIKILIEKEGGNERTIVPAMYFHDTGYEELKKGYGHDEVMAKKYGHAARSYENAKMFLPTLNYFTPKEIERICYLILNHDIHNNVTEADRQLILEADGLGQIDWYNCKPSYDKENCLKFLNTTFKDDRINYVKTETGKKYYAELLEKAYEYLEDDNNFSKK